MEPEPILATLRITQSASQLALRSPRGERTEVALFFHVLQPGPTSAVKPTRFDLCRILN
jgi:hypothetical protein